MLYASRLPLLSRGSQASREGHILQSKMLQQCSYAPRERMDPALVICGKGSVCPWVEE